MILKKWKQTDLRTVIKYFHLKALTLSEINGEIDSILLETDPSFSTVKKSVAEFRHGRVRMMNSIVDVHRSLLPPI